MAAHLFSLSSQTWKTGWVHRFELNETNLRMANIRRATPAFLDLFLGKITEEGSPGLFVTSQMVVRECSARELLAALALRPELPFNQIWSMIHRQCHGPVQEGAQLSVEGAILFRKTIGTHCLAVAFEWCQDEGGYWSADVFREDEKTPIPAGSQVVVPADIRLL